MLDGCVPNLEPSKSIKYTYSYIQLWCLEREYTQGFSHGRGGQWSETSEKEGYDSTNPCNQHQQHTAQSATHKSDRLTTVIAALNYDYIPGCIQWHLRQTELKMMRHFHHPINSSENQTIKLNLSRYKQRMFKQLKKNSFASFTLFIYNWK